MVNNPEPSKHMGMTSLSHSAVGVVGERVVYIYLFLCVRGIQFTFPLSVVRGKFVW